jgi:hypothetical protein
MYGVVRDRSRHGIHVVRVLDEILDSSQIADIPESTRARIFAKRGEYMPNVVVIQGDAKETLHVFGEAHAVRVVHEALFNTAVNWSPLELGGFSERFWHAQNQSRWKLIARGDLSLALALVAPPLLR